MQQQANFIPGFDANLKPHGHHHVVLVQGDRLLLKDRAFLHSLDTLPNSIQHLQDQALHIGYLGDDACYLLRVSQVQEEFEPASLRACIESLTGGEFAVASRALQLSHWLGRHRFCGACGSPNRLSNTECVLVCEKCEELYYPVIAPCVIGLITKGQRCLLAQNVRFKHPFYSVLAGFIEAGETVEQAFYREVKEEVNIEIKNIRYFNSQVWPFPSQLMIGLVAEYAAGEIKEDGIEIVHADWFTADDLPETPPPETLSGKLIEHFVQKNANSAQA